MKKIVVIKCAGYEGYDCKNEIVRIGSSRLLYCPSCRKEVSHKASRKWRVTPKAKLYDKEYCKSPRGIKLKKESNWRRQGIEGLTLEKWESDCRNGCMFSFLGACGGRLCADHDHETKQYRGPLCVHHNRALGKLGDTTKTLRICADILENSLYKIESQVAIVHPNDAPILKEMLDK